MADVNSNHKANLDFSDLVPRRDTFTDSDSQVYEFRSVGDFGVIDLAQSGQLRDDLTQSIDRIKVNTADVEAATDFETILEKFVSMILPDLPEPRRKSLTIGQKTKLMEFWTSHNGKRSVDAMGKSQEAQPG